MMTPADHQREFDAFLTLNHRILSLRPQEPPKPSPPSPPSVVFKEFELLREELADFKKRMAKAALEPVPLWMVPDA